MIMEPDGYSNMKKLNQYFPRFLRNVSRQSKSRIYILLDSVDQLLGNDNAFKMKWLPTKLPPYIHIIISTLPVLHGILDNTIRLIGDKNCFLELKPIEEHTGRDIVLFHMKKKKRTLTDIQMDLLMTTFLQSPSPLFLKLLIDTSLKWTSHISPGTLLLSLGKSVSAAINTLFDNLEHIYGEVLIKYTFGYLTVGVNGLSELELEDALSCNDEVLCNVYQYHKPPVPGIVRIPPLLWARIRNDIEEYIVERQSFGKTTLYWYHRQFIQVAVKRYAKGSLYKNLHADLVQLYTSERGVRRNITLDRFKLTLDNADRQTTPQPMKSTNKRKLNVLPYHLRESGNIELLKKSALCNLKFMQTVILAFSMEELLQEYSKALQDDGTSQSDMELTLMRNCLQDIGHFKNVKDLPLHLSTRLVTSHNSMPNIKELLKQCQHQLEVSTTPSLFPLYPCLAEQDMLLWGKENTSVTMPQADVGAFVLLQGVTEKSTLSVFNTVTLENSPTIIKEPNHIYQIGTTCCIFELVTSAVEECLLLNKYELKNIRTDNKYLSNTFKLPKKGPHKTVTDLIVSPCECIIAITFDYDNLNVWHIADKTVNMIIDSNSVLPNHSIHRVMFMNTMLVVLTSSMDGKHKCLVWNNVKNGKYTTLTIPAIDYANPMRCIDNTRLAAINYLKERYSFIEIDLIKQRYTETTAKFATDSDLHLDATGTLAIELSKSDCSLYSTTNGNYISTLSITDGILKQVITIEEGDYVLGASNKGILYLWNKNNLKSLGKFKCHDEAIKNVYKINDRLITEDVKNIVKVWSFKGLLHDALYDSSTQIKDIYSSNILSTCGTVLNYTWLDSKHIITNDADGIIKISELSSGKCINTITYGNDIKKEMMLLESTYLFWIDGETHSLHSCSLVNKTRVNESVVKGIPSNVQTYTYSSEKSEIFALVTENSNCSVYQYNFKTKTLVNTFTVRNKLTSNVKLKLSESEKYLIFDIEIGSKELELILKSEKKGNLSPSSGNHKFAALDLAKTGSSELMICNCMLTTLPRLGNVWENHLDSSIIIGRDR